MQPIVRQGGSALPPAPRLAERHRDADPGRMELTWPHAADPDCAFDELCAGMLS
jgi:hypothetical protein